jgi:hypothetical protein
MTQTISNQSPYESSCTVRKTLWLIMTPSSREFAMLISFPVTSTYLLFSFPIYFNTESKWKRQSWEPAESCTLLALLRL